MRNVIWRLCAFLILSLSISCTREIPTNGTSLQVNLPKEKVSASSTQVLTRVMINITGPGISVPIVKIIENHCHDCLTQTGIEGPFEFTVPKGNGRLIQVLAVYEDNAQESTSLNYGDKIIDLNGTADVEIIVTSLSSSTREGQITGRYLTGANYGPTGSVAVYYEPPGKPRMVVDFSEIINGWFDFHLLDDAPLNYVFQPENLTLFSQVSLASMSAKTPTEQVVRVKVPRPIYYTVATYNGSSFVISETRNHRGPDEIYQGFFGPAVSSTFKACYYNYDWANVLYHTIDHDQSGSTSVGDTLERLCSDLTCSQPLYFFGATIDDTRLNRISGGLDRGTYCSDPNNQFETQLSFDESLFGQGDNSHAGIKGPFRILPPSGTDYYPTYVHGSYDIATQQMNLNWNLLPGAMDPSHGISGVDAFYRTNLNNQSDLDQYRLNDGYNCQQAASDMIFGGSSSSTTLSIHALHHSVVNTTGVLICPFRWENGAKRYFQKALAIHFGHYSVDFSPLVAVQANLKIDGTTPFDVKWAISGGAPPLSYTQLSGSGSLSAGGLFTPGTGTSTIRVSDADSASVDLSLTSVSPSVNFDFTSSLPAGFSLTRSGNATYYDSDGILVTAGGHVPRFDHDPGDCLNPTSPRYCSPRGLLIESVTTNDFAYSNAFDNAAWLNFAYDPDITPNATVAPDNTATAYLIEDTNKNASNNDKLFYNNFTGHAAGTTLVFSVYVKAGTSHIMGITMQEAGVSNSDLFVDLNTGTTNSTTKPHGVEALPNGWFRVWITHVKTTTNTMTAWIMPATTISSFSPAELGSIYVWGAQMEINQKSYPTSYVATSGSAMGRVADSLNTPGPAFFSNPSASTIFLEFYNPGGPTTQMGSLLNIDQNSSGGADYLRIQGASGGGMGIQLSSSSSLLVNQSLQPPVKGNDSEKIAISFQANQFQAAMNGLNSFSTPAYTPLTGISYFSLGEGPSLTNQLNGHIQTLIYWPDTLSLPALQNLSE